MSILKVCEIVWALFIMITTMTLAFRHVTKHNTTCPMPPPCICRAAGTNTIDCIGKNLTSVPPISDTGDAWSIYLDDNRITSFSSNQFKGIQLDYLTVQNNALENIDDTAFAGSEDTLIQLLMSSNNLREFPSAIGKLKKVIQVWIDRNPIMDFNKEIFQNISQTMQYLTFGSREMHKWPSYLQYLPHLISLKLYNLSFAQIPDDAFSIWRKSMMYLELYNTSLVRLPESTKELHKIREINFEGNKNLQSDEISALMKVLPNLVNVMFKSNNFSTLPSIFSKSIILNSLSVYSEPITSLPEHLFPSTFKYFQNLFMNNTALQHVPICISKLKTLPYLFLTYGQLGKIEKEDFNAMEKLNSLDLSGNPIIFISDDSFMNNRNMSELSLQNTRLTSIPRAIQNVKTLNYLNLNGCQIQCTCTSLNWMKSWIKTPQKVQINGDCANVKMSLMDYVVHEVPKCP